MKKAKIIPLGTKLLVSIESGEPTETKSGLIIARSNEKAPQMGLIKAVGPEVTSKELKKGVTVIFAKFAGEEIELDFVKYLLIDEDDLAGIYIDADED